MNELNNNMEEFMSEFNRLHDVLQDKIGRSDDFYTLLKDMENDPVIRRYKDELHVIRKLRNILVHEKKTIDYDIATPSDKVIEQIKFIRKQIIQPATAGKYFSRRVFSFNIEDSFKRLLYFVDKNHLYQFPIFDEAGLRGILSHNGITNWLAHNHSKGQVDLRDVLIKDIVTDEETYLDYEVIATNTTLFDVEELFSNNLLKGRNQYVVLLSDKADIRKWEDIDGIITPWDVPHLLSLIQFE